ncbi:hypothetical protein [Paenochrobactrum pullorum]|uniref:hypothetical protein n=1 Tax=Paenochrobactrum pullorum TaxID=1324351 RepID=UPI0035BBDA3A
MEPAKTIILCLGGSSSVAAIVGVHRTRVWNWMRPKEKGGTGGVIPFKHAPLLIAVAHQRGIDLTADDFLPPITLEIQDDVSLTKLNEEGVNGSI